MLFPQHSKHAAQWFHHLQHRGQALYFKEQHLDIIILGRRWQDGNYTGGKGQNIYTNAQGVTRYSPIAHWKHEEVLAVIHYFLNRQIPPLYSWKNGWIVGTGVWPARQWIKSHQEGWRELWDIDPQMVYDAAPYIASAQEFINNQNI